MTCLMQNNNPENKNKTMPLTVLLMGVSAAFLISSIPTSFAEGTPTLFGEHPDGVRHIPYNGLCAPGFANLGHLCVLDDRCGPGIYAGKVCVVNGIEQPYLRPLQQGNAGIPAGDVICAEGLERMFKNDASPICVKPESVKKLESRGLHSNIPPIACTANYAPVCGVNGKTYGNMCNLNADHVALKNDGECTE